MSTHPRVQAKAKRIARAQRFKALAEKMSYAAIGRKQKPPISGQRVGKLIESLNKE